jgi:hypothetical protein
MTCRSASQSGSSTGTADMQGLQIIPASPISACDPRPRPWRGRSRVRLSDRRTLGSGAACDPATGSDETLARRCCRSEPRPPAGSPARLAAGEAEVVDSALPCGTRPASAGPQPLRPERNRSHRSPRPCWGAHLHRTKAEVRWIMLEEDPEPTRTIRSHATLGNDASQCDGLAVLLLQGLQAGSVPPGVLAGQVAHLQALNPYRHGVGVIGLSGSAARTAYTSSRTRPSGERRSRMMRQGLSW